MRSFWKEGSTDLGAFRGERVEKEGRRDPAQHRAGQGVPEVETDGEMSEESTEMLRIVLGTEMGATALPADVVEALIPFLMESLMVKGPDDLKRMGVDAFVAAVASLPPFEDGALPEPAAGASR